MKPVAQTSEALHSSIAHMPHEPASGTTHIVKASLGADTRRLPVVWSSDANASEVLMKISKALQCGFNLESTKDVLLKYTDEDGEMLTLVEPTVHDFLSAQHGTLRVYVERLGVSSAADAQDANTLTTTSCLQIAPERQASISSTLQALWLQC